MCDVIVPITNLMLCPCLRRQHGLGDTLDRWKAIYAAAAASLCIFSPCLCSGLRGRQHFVRLYESHWSWQRFTTVVLFQIDSLSKRTEKPFASYLFALSPSVVMMEEKMEVVGGFSNQCFLFILKLTGSACSSKNV